MQSSRRQEIEAQRNLGRFWLTGRLAPDFKTIADFRCDNGDASRKACKECLPLYRRMKLFTDGIVAIDGSKFKTATSGQGTGIVGCNVRTVAMPSTARSRPMRSLIKLMRASGDRPSSFGHWQCILWA